MVHFFSSSFPKSAIEFKKSAALSEKVCNRCEFAATFTKICSVLASVILAGNCSGITKVCKPMWNLKLFSFLSISGARNLQELAEVTARACGGVHTLTYPHSQAVVRGLQLNRDDFDLLLPQKDFQPVDILGQDGHIYKGLLESLPPTLPHIPQKNKSPGIKNPPRNLRRSTTPSSPSVQKTLPDEAESS